MHRALLLLELAQELRFLSAEHAQSIREALTPKHARRFEQWVVECSLMSRSLLRAVAAATAESHWQCMACKALLTGADLAWHGSQVLCPQCHGDELRVCSRLIPPVPQPFAVPPTLEEVEAVQQVPERPVPRSRPVPRRRPPTPRRRRAEPIRERPLATANQATNDTARNDDTSSILSVPAPSLTATSSPPRSPSGRLRAPSSLDPAAGLPVGFMVRQWHVLRPIGRGGMGTVYLGYDPELYEYAAIKVLPFASRRNPQRAISRFEREARAYAQLDHPNVVRMRDFVRFETFDCIVLEWCNGGSLSQRLRDHGPLPGLAEIVELGRHVVAGLAHAHEAGLVHRDVKAENILWRHCTRGTTRWIKVADFGIVKELHTERHLTAPGAVIGTPSNMAPEQVMGEPATTAVDVYALACVLYQAATGRQPYAGLNKAEVFCRHLEEPFPSLSEKRPTLPARFERLLTCMAAKRPNERPSLDEVDEELASLHGNEKSPRHVTTRRIYARHMPTPLPLARGLVARKPANGGLPEQAATSLMTLPESDEVALDRRGNEMPASTTATRRENTTTVSRERLHLAYGVELSDDGTTAVLVSGDVVTAARGQRLAQAAHKAVLLGVHGVVIDFVGCLHMELDAQRTFVHTLKRLQHFHVRSALAAAPKRVELLVQMHGLWPSVALCRARAQACETIRHSATTAFGALP